MIISKHARKEQGNMLVMTLLVVAAIALMIIVGLVIYNIFFAHQRLQNEGEELALSLAQVCNAGDRAGQMNNMINYARELMINSNQVNDIAREKYPQMQALSYQLLRQAREGAQEVISEQDRLMQFTVQDIKRVAKEAEERNAKKSSLNLLYASSKPIKIESIQIGSLKGVESNVEAPIGDDLLLEYDREHGYIDKNTNLYYAKKSVKLLDVDPSLDFKFSSLPAPIKGTVSPLRLATMKVFEGAEFVVKNGKDASGKCSFIPSAIYLKAESDISGSAGKTNEGKLSVNIVAASVGANLPP